jgi:hypothetical protein
MRVDQFSNTQIAQLSRLGFSMEPKYDLATMNNVLQLTHLNKDTANLAKLTDSVYQLSMNMVVFRKCHTFASYLEATAPHLRVSHISDSFDTYDNDHELFCVAITAPYTGTISRKEFLAFFKLYQQDVMTALKISLSAFDEVDNDEDGDDDDTEFNDLDIEDNDSSGLASDLSN